MTVILNDSVNQQSIPAIARQRIHHDQSLIISLTTVQSKIQ